MLVFRILSAPIALLQYMYAYLADLVISRSTTYIDFGTFFFVLVFVSMFTFISVTRTIVLLNLPYQAKRAEPDEPWIEYGWKAINLVLYTVIGYLSLAVASWLYLLIFFR